MMPSLTNAPHRRTRVCRLYGVHDLRIETENTEEPGRGQVLVRVGAGGICGSDLHYYHDGGFGPIRVKQPIILGHEIAGTVEALGEGVSALAIGDRVAVNPSRSCGRCKYCLQDLNQHCLDMRFYGSALRDPHEQGGFRDLIVTEAVQCEKVGAHVSLAEAACAEPLAVCLHARTRAGDLSGKRILVTGSGPIGALCVAVARQAGAQEIVVTDLQDAPLAIARHMGATAAVNIGREPAALEAYQADKGYFDVAFECSAAGPALRLAIATTRPQGTIVQVGVTGDLPLPVNQLVGKEIAMIGSHRFHREYAQAVRLINAGDIDVRPIITATYPLEHALDAFAAASDRTTSSKVQLSFTA
jgi:L-idonate 5-dehydrogenase